MNLSKHLLTDWLGVSIYCGIVWVKEGPWRDLEICASPKVGVGRRPPSAPLPGKWGGGKRPLIPPPCSYAYVHA